MRFPIKYKLASIILITLTPLVAFTISHYFEMIDNGKKQLRSRNIAIATEIAATLDERIGKSFGVLRPIAEHPAVISRDSRQCDKLFARLLPSYPSHLNILAAGMNGYNYGSGVFSQGVRLLNYKDKEWFWKGSKGLPIVGDLHISKLFKSPSVMLTMPVFDGRKNQVGVLGFPLNLFSVAERLTKSWQLPDKSVITVVDSKGNVLIDTYNRQNIGKNLKDSLLIKKVFAANSGFEEDAGIDGVRRLYSFASLSNAPWKVIVGVPTEQAYYSAYRFGRNYIGIAIAAFSAALMLSLFFNRRIAGNIASLVTGLKEIERGNLDFTLKLSGHDELNEVAGSFNKMASERKKAEEQVWESRSFLSSILEGIGQGVVVIDRDFRIISANKGYCEQAKMPCEDIIGKYCYEVSHHRKEPCYGDRCGYECSIKKCFETGEHQRAIHTHYRSDGNPIFVETNAYPLKDASGKIVSGIETLMDVTDIVKLEKKLEEASERYRKLYDEAPDMMHSVDIEGIIAVCNNTMATALGYDIDDLIGRPYTKIIAPEAKPACMQKFEFLRNSGFCEGEAIYVSKEGRRIPIFLKARALSDENGNFLMADIVSRDITDKKMLEAQLLQAQKLEAIGTLTGGIAHDFNNILTAIMGYGNLAEMKMKEDDPLRTYIEQILSATGRAANLTRSLLAFGRKQIINPMPVNLNKIVKMVETLLSRLIGEMIELELDITDRDLIIMADKGQIEQVLINIATNARDAMPEGGILTIKVETVKMEREYIQTHNYGKSGVYARISFSDTGTGMDKRTTERIFEPFFTTKEVGKGTGLGLSIVYGIVKQHNGYIDVYSTPGQGALFNIYLPLIGSEAEETNSTVPPVLTGGTEAVLIAEDNEEVRRLTRHILEKFGYKVTEAADGVEAIRVFSQNKDGIDLILLDVIMPRKNGKETYDEIKKIRPGMKVIFMSGYAEDIIQNKVILDEGLNFVSKPVSPGELLKKVRETLDA